MSINNPTQEDSDIFVPSLDHSDNVDLCVVEPMTSLDSAGYESAKAIDKTSTLLDCVREKSARVQDMADLHESIATESGVCQADFLLINDIYGKTVLEDTYIKHYTAAPSSVNYALVINRTRKAMACENEVINETLTQVAQALKDDVVGALEKVHSTYVPLLSKTIQDNMQTYPLLGRNISNGVMVISKEENKEVVDITKTQLGSIPNKTKPPIVLDFPNESLEKAYSALSTIAQWKHVRYIAYCIGQNKPYKDIFEDNDLCISAKTHTPTIVELVKLTCTQAGVDFIQSVNDYSVSLSNKIEKAALACTDSNFYLCDNIDTVSEDVHTAKEIIAACLYTTHVSFVLSQLLDFLNTSSE